ncbi:unnamed protein product [Parnassius apollo]|uniref:(apollo) hypothetical protein n=1 Tax=Parnassius apollo TaxID=110799 RepID=A0A8S3XNM1_PARAO|nr:unnamed protein product [Parnassius apollo]
MKYFIALALFAAMASASVIPPAVIASDNPEIQEIVAAIQSPSTDPATAAALEQMLLDILGLNQPEPVEVGPAVVDNPEPISIGPAIIDFPLPDGGAVTEVHPAPVMPAPVAPSAGAPLVQIILNIMSTSDVAGSPVAIETIPSPSPAPTPVHVVDEAIEPMPVIVVDKPIVPEPVTVVEEAAVPEAVIVAQPIIAVPAVVPPEILN